MQPGGYSHITVQCALVNGRCSNVLLEDICPILRRQVALNNPVIPFSD